MAAISTKEVPAGLPEISVPHNVAERNYGGAMADIMSALATSRAADARELTADKFRWSLAYKQCPDPAETDPVRFAQALSAGSVVYLIARGAKWRGCATLGWTPPQVMAKFEERARLMCGQNREPEQASGQHPLLAAFDQWAESARMQDDALAAYVRSGIAALVRR